MRKELKPGRYYIVVNLDEPYAPELYDVIKRGQTAKGQWPEGDISFREWVEETWPDDPLALDAAGFDIFGEG